MNNKGFEADFDLDQTPNFADAAEKPLNFEKEQPKKVDINVLKARAQDIQNKENRKNVFTLIFFIIVLAAVGVYLSI